jgi:hypothetical protein
LLANVRNISDSKLVLLVFHQAEDLFHLSTLNLTLLLALICCHGRLDLLLCNSLRCLFNLTLDVRTELDGVRSRGAGMKISFGLLR